MFCDKMGLWLSQELAAVRRGRSNGDMRRRILLVYHE